MEAIERVLLTLWVGALWSVGYLAVPVLFASLDERMLAGMLAGKMFTLVSYLGVIVAAVLAAGQWLRQRGRPGWRFWLLLAMLALVASGEFTIQPIMVELKRQGLTPGSVAAARFGRMHAISSSLYMIVSLAGLVLVAKGLRPIKAR